MWDPGHVSRRDLAHLMAALADAAHAEAGVGVSVEALDEAIGRGRKDMRTPLNLASLEARAAPAAEPRVAGGGWPRAQARRRLMGADRGRCRVAAPGPGAVGSVA